MELPRHQFGLDRYCYGIRTTDFRLEYLSSEWDAEKTRSSKIEVIPAAGIIVKKKERSLDKLVYETFSTIFFAKLFESYDAALPKRDFTIYSPQGIRMEYGGKNIKNSTSSTLYEFFCPGLPLNKLQNSKKRDHGVGKEKVRMDERVCYLAGVLHEIMRREGLIHGDPNRRHFLLLPRSEGLTYMKENCQVAHYDAKNGLGVIDVENAKIEGEGSRGVLAELDLFMKRVLEKFNSPRNEEYFARGGRYVRENCGNKKFRDCALKNAKQIFDQRFEGSLVGDVDMRTKKVSYKKK